MNGAIATIRITVAAAIPVHIHGSLRTYRKPSPSSRRMPSVGPGSNDARPREPECRRRDEERCSLDRPDDGRAGRVVERRGDRRGRRSRCRSARRRATSSPTGASAARRRAARCPRTPAGRSRRRARTASRARGSPASVTWPVTSSTKNAAITQQRARSEPIISSRREYRSASTPPQSRVRSIASDSSASTNPSELAFPVRSVTRQPSATMNAASPTNDTVWPPQMSRKSRLENATNVPCRGTVTVRGYRRARDRSRRRLRRRFHAREAGAGPRPRGVRASRRAVRDDARPGAATTSARRAAFVDLKRHPELDHDEEIWIRFTQRIIEGMGGAGDTYAAACEMEGGWAHAHHFELYEDVLADARRAARPGPQARAALEQRARPRRVRRPPRPVRRRRADLAGAREDEAARGDLPAHARAARRGGRRRGHGRRHDRGRRRRRPRQSECGRCWSTGKAATRSTTRSPASARY